MKIILKENIDNLGKRGDIIDVAAGYGRNYLIPRKMAIEVTPSNMKLIEMEQKSLRKKLEREVKSYQSIIDQINQASISFERKAGDKDVIFGSVSASDIKDALGRLGIEVDRKKILLVEPIKRLGNFTVPVKIFHDERAEIKIEVKKEGAEEEEKKVVETGETVAAEKIDEEKEKVTEESAAEAEQDKTEEVVEEKEEAAEEDQPEPEEEIEEPEEEQADIPDKEPEEASEEEKKEQ